ncbi:MAG TPA: tRNA (guanine(46)-N(7))-methyltransferase TrmB [Rhabdochlamydiaceae bacterium]|nr:tRNA (guanine(46)-N(7))-methyltransferase TrmB [Rhabdochlamydiaceae bacterium]
MKPTDLKYPFKWEERRPELHQKVLFVPHFYQNHELWKFPGWEDPALFGKKGKVILEYCSGNGSWVIQKALKEPHAHWIAIEKKFDRVRKIWSKLQKLSLNNLLVVCGEALTFTRYYLPPNTVDEIYINFPDPWPKLKHAKHRLIQSPFVEELLRILKQGGKAVFVTDHEDYSKQIVREMLLSKQWKSCFAPPYYATSWENYGTSYFDDLWRKKGKTIHYHQFENVKEGYAY